MGHCRILIAVAVAALAAVGRAWGQEQDDNPRREALETVWSYQAATADKDAMTRVALDAEGNCLAVGRTQGGLAGTNSGDCDIILMKFDPDGGQQWIRQFGGPRHDEPTGVAVDAAGNCYASGETPSGLFENVLVGQPDSTGVNVFLVKYDPQGELLWGLLLGGVNGDHSRDIAVDDDDNCFVVGYTSSDLDGKHQGGGDVFIAKFTADGELAWVRQFGTPQEDKGVAVDIDAAGNCYVGGLTVGDMEGESNGGHDMFVAKYDSDGERLWVIQYGSEERDVCAGLAYDRTNECFYAVGHTDGELVEESAGGRDGWVIQFDPGGNWLWGQHIGSDGNDAANTVAADAEGCYVGGKAGGYLEGTGWGGYQMFLARIDIDGNRLWVHQFGPEGVALFSDVAVDAEGNCTMVGDHTGDFIGPNQGGKDGFVVKVVHETNKDR